MNKIRIDKFLVENKFVKSREIAKKIIKSNNVLVNGVIVNKTNFLIDITSKIELLKNEKYVSRAAYKLLKAIEVFKINLNNKIVMDIGSSTGGFTQVLLENNVDKVYCIDVGTDQLDKSLRNNKKITLMENTNFKNINWDNFNDVNFFTCDVSFISIEKILDKIKTFNKKNIYGVFLLKPQFELTKKEVSKHKGRVEKQYLNKVINNFNNYCLKNNYKIINFIESPLLGAKKHNIEYLVYMEM